jgi:hypothetical protein
VKPGALVVYESHIDGKGYPCILIKTETQGFTSSSGEDKWVFADVQFTNNVPPELKKMVNSGRVKIPLIQIEPIEKFTSEELDA